MQNRVYLLDYSSKPDDVIPALLQVQAVSTACRMGQKDIDLASVPVILVLRGLQLTDPQLRFLKRFPQPGPVMLEIIKDQYRLTL